MHAHLIAMHTEQPYVSNMEEHQEVERRGSLPKQREAYCSDRCVLNSQ